MFEKVILVDSNDTVVGEMEKLEAHRKALLHRAISVFIFNSRGELLLQKRATTKYHSPGLWTNTACTHPQPNESNENAAIRRLNEEMGIKGVKLIKLFDFIYKEKFDNGLTEHEFDHVFTGVTDDVPYPNITEVSEFKYIECNNLLQDIKENPQDYTVWFKKIVERVLNKIQCLNFNQ